MMVRDVGSEMDETIIEREVGDVKHSRGGWCPFRFSGDSIRPESLEHQRKGLWH